jgi:hypothetical protein
MKTLDTSQFYGTDQYHRWSALFPQVLTDGAKYVADELQCYWLMDIIASVQTILKINREPFQVWKLQRDLDGGCTITCEDGNLNEIYEQYVEYTNIQVDELTLWLQNGVIFLPSEY